MDKSKELEILESLCEGINPSTGEIFPDDSLYQQPDIIRALFKATKALEFMENTNKKKKVFHENAGKSWYEEDDEKLIEQFDLGMSIKELAKNHQRTAGAIKARLTKLGKLEISYS